MIDPIGYFRGKAVTEMSRDELIDFAKWAGNRIWELQKIEQSTQDYRLDLEVRRNLIK